MSDVPARPPGEWEIEYRTGTAQDLHDLAVPVRPLVRVHRVTAAAVVLGSTQPVGTVDARALVAGRVELARRRSGGGAVWLAPAAQVWVDVVVPAGHPHWDDDVQRATWWLGEAWARTLGELAPSRQLEVRRGGVTDRAAGRVACFAATGPGEVALDGAKVVGVSQRRTRQAARFQCVAYLDPAAPTALLALLAADAAAVPGVADRLSSEVAPLPVPPDGGWDVVERLIAHF
jgi:lipoate---protein ligase